MPRCLILKIWHPGCWAIDLTEEWSGIQVEAGTIHRSDPYNVADELIYGEDAEQEAFRVWASRDSRILQNYLVEPPSGSRPARYLTRYRLPNSLLDLLFAHQLVLMEPLWVREGYDYCKVVVPYDDGLTRFLEDAERLGYDISALSAHRMEGRDRPSARCGGGNRVTARQLEVAERALEMGYYSWPREASGKELARRLGVSPPTALEHLRKLEARVVRAFLQEVREEREARESSASRRKE